MKHLFATKTLAALMIGLVAATGLALAGARGYPLDDVPSLESAVAAADHPVKLSAEERIQTIIATREGGLGMPGVEVRGAADAAMATDSDRRVLR